MTNDSAFPVVPPVDAEGEIPSHFPPWECGLTKRELFAAIAMHAIVSHAGPVNRDDPLRDECLANVSKTATDYADALLERLSDD